MLSGWVFQNGNIHDERSIYLSKCFPLSSFGKWQTTLPYCLRKCASNYQLSQLGFLGHHQEYFFQPCRQDLHRHKQLWYICLIFFFFCCLNTSWCTPAVKKKHQSAFLSFHFTFIPLLLSLQKMISHGLVKKMQGPRFGISYSIGKSRWLRRESFSSSSAIRIT